MNPELAQNIELLNKATVYFDNFQDDILIAEFNHSPNGATGPILFPPPSRHEALTFLGVMTGELGISVDYSPYNIPANGIVWIMQTHIMQVTGIAQGTRVWMLQLTKSFMDDNIQHRFGSTPMISYMQLKKYPYSLFEPEEFKSLYDHLQTIRDKFKLNAHSFQKEVVKIYLKAFALDMAHFFFRKKDNFLVPQLTRKEELFADFLSLLTEHCKTQHEVSFYAGKLCITPQYLSLILKEQSGRTASQWIQNALVVEAKRMLKMSRTSIQEVADNLNFPDQSTFGKFFRKHAGLSPLAFRKYR
ncbi:MAG: helix-turn-helix transcriptional regulator [Tannerella sp.]|jgi:AraC-like DNA-binding protein|nr:helix-turn-helix transcriptional regulator [Tannerella sp.]